MRGITNRQVMEALRGLGAQIGQMHQDVDHKLRRIIVAQADIDAATQAIQTAVGIIQTDDDNLNTAVTAIQSYITAHPDEDVSELNAAVAAIGTTTDNLTAAVSGAQGAVPSAPVTPPASS